MESTENNIDSYALYIFLFLSFLSVGNDFYHVYSNILEHDFVKKNINKMNNYTELFGNILCNNVKQRKNKLICDIKEKIQKPKKNKIKKEKEEDKKELKENNQKQKLENEMIEKKTDNNYENNINIMRNIVKKEESKKKSTRRIKKET
tara:strand:+ start:4785 stop:5228 length:444 start_codon:yes stop_codon:yes gene_type:complete